MTTIDERIRALIWGRQLLEDVVADPAMSAQQRGQAALLLVGYPEAEAIVNRLNIFTDAELLCAAQHFVATARLLLELRFSRTVSSDWAERATRVERHFPQQGDMTMDGAVYWATFYLGRGRDGPVNIEEGLPYINDLKRIDAQDVTAGRRTARSLHAVQPGALDSAVFMSNPNSEYGHLGEGWEQHWVVFERQARADGWIDGEGFWAGPPDCVELREFAANVLGSRDLADAWMLEHAPGLKGRRPIDLVETDEGRREVGVFLARLQAGVYC